MFGTMAELTTRVAGISEGTMDITVASDPHEDESKLDKTNSSNVVDGKEDESQGDVDADSRTIATTPDDEGAVDTPWVCFIDEDTQSRYWYNASNGETTWEAPESFVYDQSTTEYMSRRGSLLSRASVSRGTRPSRVPRTIIPDISEEHEDVSVLREEKLHLESKMKEMEQKLKEQEELTRLLEEKNRHTEERFEKEVRIRVLSETSRLRNSVDHLYLINK